MIRKAASFRFRAFGVFWLTFSFLLSALSGAILFLRPEGSLATWTGWTALGLNKKQWEGVHAVFVLTLVVSAAIHLLYNWRPLLAYCRLKKDKIRTVSQGLAACREFIAAALLTATVLIGAMGEWLPVHWIARLARSIQKWRRAGDYRPSGCRCRQIFPVRALCPYRYFRTTGFAQRQGQWPATPRLGRDID